MSGSGISWDIMQACNLLQTDNHASSPPLSFYRPDALPAAQPTASKHWALKAIKCFLSEWITCSVNSDREIPIMTTIFSCFCHEELFFVACRCPTLYVLYNTRCCCASLRSCVQPVTTKWRHQKLTCFIVESADSRNSLVATSEVFMV